MAKQQGQMTTPYYTPSKKQQGTTFSTTPSVSGVSQGGWGTRLGKLRHQATHTLKGQFIVLAMSNMLLALLLALFISQSFQRAADDLTTITQDSIPSVNSAQEIAQYIDDIDAKAADYLAAAGLNNLIPCTVPGSTHAAMFTVHDCDSRTIDAETVLTNKVLFDASHNVTFPGERTAVERITAGFEEYSADLTVMRYEFTQALSKTDIHDVHLRKAYDAYLKASNVLHNHITQQPLLKADGTPIFDEPSLPMCVIGGHTMQPREWALGSIETNVDCLSGINKVHLDQAYDDTVGFLGESAFLVGMGCLLFCLLLLFTAGRMVRMTHRIINIGLTLAVVVAVIYSVAVVDLFSTLSGRHGAYGQLVKDDYDSVYYAAQLQRDGTNANADESRWLIALEFNDQSSINRWQADWQTNTQRVQSLIQHAQDNRTWPEEDQPLADIHANWQSYFGLDDRIRSTANNTANPRHLLDAEQLSTGDSNRKFSGFFDAVGRLSAANQQHFDTTDASTQQSLGFYLLLSALLFPLLGLMAVWGISRRLPDF